MSEDKDLFDLSGKVVILTGGLGLLGLNFTEALLKQGATLHVVDVMKETEAISQLKHLPYPDRLHYHQGDITNKDSLMMIRDRCLRESGDINVLINAAALNPKVEKDALNSKRTNSTFEEATLDDWNREIKVNLTGSMLCCQVFGTAMKYGSSIINIASVFALVGPDQSIYPQGFIKPASYGVSKGGVVSLTKYLASYWGKKGVRVNCVSFGGVKNAQDEQFIKNYSSKTFLKRMAEPNEYNGLIVFLASNASSYMTGSNIIIDGGLTS